MDEVELLSADLTHTLSLPFANGGIRAGFPSPAQDYLEEALDLNQELIANPMATFYGRVKGDSMIDAGVESGDILVIDRSIEPDCGLSGRRVHAQVRGPVTQGYRRYLAGSRQQQLPAHKDYT